MKLSPEERIVVGNLMLDHLEAKQRRALYAHEAQQLGEALSTVAMYLQKPSNDLYKRAAEPYLDKVDGKSVAEIMLCIRDADTTIAKLKETLTDLGYPTQ